MSLNPQSFRFRMEESVAWLTLDRPEVLNAITFEVYAELREAFLALDSEPGVRAVVLTGTGRAFCSGGDVEKIIGELFARDRAGLLEFTRQTCDLVRAIRACRRPVIAAVNGLTAGAGAVIATACDFRIASDTAKIAFLFTKVGLSGADMGASWLLPRIVGLARATHLLMLGDFLDAREAERIGLYHVVVPADRVADEARSLAGRLARGPSEALAVTKSMLNREGSMDLWTALETEAQEQARCMTHPNFREAYEAFRAKREPNFR